MTWFSNFSYGRRKRELQEEIDDHLRMAIADRMDLGETEEAARQAALREFGNVALIKDVTRETWGWTKVERLGHDLCYAFRQIRRTPIFAATVIGTLALGIAAAASMFTVVEHVMLRPVSYKDAGRLVMILAGAGKEPKGQYLSPWPDIQEWMNRSQSFQQIAFWGTMGGRNYLEEKTSAFKINGFSVSSDLFPMLGVEPTLGHGFFSETPSLTAGRNTGTILLSDTVWHAPFGGDASALGQVVIINNLPYTVIGVMPRGFAFPLSDTEAGQVWVPVQLAKDDQGRSYEAMNYEAMGKLRKGGTLSAARAE